MSALAFGPTRLWREKYPEAATLGELHAVDPELARDVLSWYAEVVQEEDDADDDDDR